MTAVLLLLALVLPIALFLALRGPPRLGARKATAFAVGTGWVLNLAWAWSAEETLAIAAGLGWLCPALLVLITALVLRVVERRAG